LYRTDGIVIRRRDQGEADRVLALCTPLGKLEVIAKGARKVRSRKAGHIELFSHSSFVLARVPNSWDIISQAETVESHALLRSDLLRGTYARYADELLDRFFAQDEGDQALFDLLGHTLSWLCRDEDLDLVARFYEQHLLGLAGFRPELFRCVGGHRQPVALQPSRLADARRRYDAGQSFGFDPERGGGLCPRCFADTRGPSNIPALSADGLRFLQRCQREPITSLRTRPIAAGLHAEVERVMHHYVTYHLERSVKSGAFLRQLKQEQWMD
jgi:DNA repair protein RecO (recombination protein O)